MRQKTVVLETVQNLPSILQELYGPNEVKTLLGDSVASADAPRESEESSPPLSGRTIKYKNVPNVRNVLTDV